MGDAAQILLNLPLKEYQAIGQYYLGWLEFMKGGAAKKILEQAAEHSPAEFRALAMLSLAAIEAREQDYASELRWLSESLKLSPSIEALRGIAIVKAKEGYHRISLKELEGLMPLARFSERLHYYDFLNSYAVQLGKVGRTEEALNISRLVLASPFAYAYPEWQDTTNDLRGSRRSFVAVHSPQDIPHNVVIMPVVEHGGEPSLAESKPARVLDLQEWKNKMGKGKNGHGEKPGGELNGQAMLMRIMQVYINNNTTDEQRRKIYDYALRIASGPPKPDAPKPDDAGGA
ncbi:MAG TPA: hypothetical protein VNI02_15410 [Blastocatellia bacterium]|nr:hypothetical protein [Blastocatellia bacterium]